VNYTVKSVLIICAVAVVSFFVAELVIPEKNAGATVSAPAKEKPRADQAAAPATGGITPAAAPSVPPQMTAAPTAAKAPPAPEAKTIPPATKAAPETKVAAPETKTVTPPVAPAVATPAPQPATPDTAKKAKAQKTASGISAENIAVCTAVQDKTPVGISNKFTKDTKQVYFYTLITGARDTTPVVHRWYHNGKLVQTSFLSIRSPYWRTHSRRKLQDATVADPAGDWRVDVVEGKTGQVMGSTSFTVVE